jgi:hypothetical protein
MTLNVVWACSLCDAAVLDRFLIRRERGGGGGGGGVVMNRYL